MKTILTPILLCASLAAASAQGTLQFTASLNGANEVPPNASLATGTAYLTLNDTTLNVFVDLPYLPGSFVPVGAFIHGPAALGATAPMLFDLGTPFSRPPFPPTDPSGDEFVRNGIALSSFQITELMNGLWYINVASSAFPDGELRGQIQAVPEPSTATLLSFGGAAALMFLRRHGTR